MMIALARNVQGEIVITKKITIFEEKKKMDELLTNKKEQFTSVIRMVTYDITTIFLFFFISKTARYMYLILSFG